MTRMHLALPLALAVTSLLMTSCMAQTVLITSPTSDISVSPGQRVVITCEITGITNSERESGKVTWGRFAANIFPLTSDGINYAIQNSTFSRGLRSKLTIFSVAYEDDGTLFCTWTLRNERSDYITVTVTGEADILELRLTSQPVTGRDVAITCLAQGRPVPSIQWRGPNNVAIAQIGTPYDVSTSSISNDRVLSRLTLSGVTSQVTGAYRCLATNNLGTQDDSVNLQLEPWVSIFRPVDGDRNPPDNSTLVMPLGPAVVVCKVYNVKRYIDINWSFRPDTAAGQFAAVTKGADVSVTPPTSTALLSAADQLYVMTSELRYDATFDLQGTVRCLALDGGVLAEFQRDVSVEDVPEISFSPSEVEVGVGEEVELLCTVRAHPPVISTSITKNLTPMISFKWNPNSTTENLRSDFRITREADLFDIITCYGQNAYGTASVDLIIKDRDECEEFDVCAEEGEECVNTLGSFRCQCGNDYYRGSNGACIRYIDPTGTTLTPPLTSSGSFFTRAPATTTNPTTSTTTTTTTTQQPGGESQKSKGGDEVLLYAGVGAGAAVVIIIIVIVVVVILRRRGQSSDMEPKPSRSQPPPPEMITHSGTTYNNPAFGNNLEGYTYTQLGTPGTDRSEFPRERLQMMEKLGQGKFGMVARALALSIQSNGKWDTVAVKQLKEAATDGEKSEFSRELTLLRSLPRHQNVVMFVGCCTLQDPTLIIMEYCEKGDLLSYLRQRRPSKKNQQQVNDITARDMFSFALQVARGMAHIAANKIIHRDVATRNVLIDNRNVAKVSDLGLSRRLGEDNDVYEIVSRRPLPIRWMSPESLRDGVHTSQSDVWSYGVLLWELVTLGASPYPGHTGKTVIDFVIEGRYPDIPPHCTGDLATIMTSCWSMDASLRPTFDVIAGKFEKLLEQEGDYLSLDNLGEGIYSVLDPMDSGERV